MTTDSPSTPPVDHRYRRALSILWRRSGWERGLITNPFGGEDAGRLGLRRVRALVDALGAPDTSVRMLHVAGSKGKGSTAALAAAALTASGRKTGLYTSPHLHGFNERVAIDGQPLDRAIFGDLAVRTDEAASVLERDQPDLGAITTFELLTAMAFLAFAEAGCDVAVIEVGLGGDYDATNVIDPAACAITRIDLEHTAILGDTLAAIAATKAGIIKPHRPVAIGPNPPEAKSVFEAAADGVASQLLLGGRDWTTAGGWQSCTLSGPWGALREVALSLPGDHQVENAGTAAAALWLLAEAGMPVGEAAVRAGFAAARWPGRFERVERDGVIVLDGAHTPAAAAALRRTLEHEFPDESAVFVLGCSSDKPVAEIVSELAPVASRIVAVRANVARSMDPVQIVEAATAAGLPATNAGSVAGGLAAAHGDLMVVTGSLFVVGEAREALGLAEADPEWGPALAEG
jgi:dihydrofolate synthase/folylpolyglutamate synthase